VSKKGKLPLGKVYLTDRAISDLLNVELYSIETWGKAVAKRYLLKFEKAFRLIELNPDLLRPNPSLHESLLFYRVEKHLVACIRFKRGIAVLTVTHASRDLPSVLHKLSPTLNQEITILLSKIGQQS